jgi:hypothetical protein
VDKQIKLGTIELIFTQNGIALDIGKGDPLKLEKDLDKLNYQYGYKLRKIIERFYEFGYIITDDLNYNIDNI